MSEAAELLRRLRWRRAELDFSDYLDLRRARDRGLRSPDLDLLLTHLETALPVPFAQAIPDLATLADAAQSPPRMVTREALRAALALREEFARHGEARASLMGLDLPEGEGLKDWLDFVEEERKQALRVKTLLRELDRKLHGVFTGHRGLPKAGWPDALRQG